MMMMMMMMMICLQLLINMMMGRGMEAEERGVSLDVMTVIPSFVWDFPFTSMLPWVC
jgi:hypothetical protein